MGGSKFDQLLDVLERCTTACQKYVSGDLRSGNGAMGHCTSLALDCSEIAGVTAKFVARGSRFMNELLMQCSIICKECEDVLRQHDVVTAQECAEICHECHLACALVAQPH